MQPLMSAERPACIELIELANGTRTTVATGANALCDALEQLDSRLERAGITTAVTMRPGLPPAEVQAKFKAVGLTAPDELVALYGWHDGYAPEGYERWPLPDIALAPLDIVLERFAGREQVAGTHLELDAPLVILEADVRGHAVLCDRPPSEPPEVLFFSEDERVLERDGPVGRSICTWVASWILRIDLGAVRAVGPVDRREWRIDQAKAAALFNSLALA